MEKREQLFEFGFDTLSFFEPEFCDEAIIGISIDGHVIYSYEKLVNAFINNENMTFEEAEEWISYNTIRTVPYMEVPPIIINELAEYYG